jgi:TRAP-type C4-dicarboxylate transport system permease large subunit
MLGAVRTTAMVLLVIGTAGSFGWLMAFLQVPQATIGTMKTVSDNPSVVLLMISLILLEHFRAKWTPVRMKKMRQNKELEHFRDSEKRGNAPVLGTLMEMAPMIIICTPIFLPVVKASTPVHFGVILILHAGIGLNTPPVGSVQFVACAIGRISTGQSMKTIWPFYGASIAVLLLVTYVPAVSLWLPGVFR